MNRANFYASVRQRASGVFGTSLSQGQVEGCEAILDEAERRGTPLFHLAAIFSEVCLWPAPRRGRASSRSKPCNPKRKSWKGRATMPRFSAWTIILCASLTLVGCASATVSGCSPFQKNNLSPAGTVALLQADRSGAERVIGNDRAGARKGCWD